MNKWKEIWNKRDSETDTLDNIKNDIDELDIKFVRSDMKGYWNNPFLFNVFMYKRS